MFSFSNNEHLYLHIEWVHLQEGTIIVLLHIYNSPEHGSAQDFVILSSHQSWHEKDVMLSILPLDATKGALTLVNLHATLPWPRQSLNVVLVAAQGL